MDVEDPDLFAAEPLMKFEKSEKGKWVLEHSKTIPVWKRVAEFGNWGWTYVITAEFEDAALTEWILKYGDG
jgi:hypothetical protein